MLSYISYKSAKLLESKYKTSNTSYTEIYVYGFTLLFSTLFTATAITLLSLLYGNIIYGLVFIFFFVPLKLNLGGYHAKTFCGCFLFSVSLFTTIYVLISNIQIAYIWPITIILLPCVSIVLFMMKPKVPFNHSVSNELLLKCKKKANYYILVDLFIIVFLITNNDLKRYGFLILLIHFSIMILNLNKLDIRTLGEYLERRKKHDI